MKIKHLLFGFIFVFSCLASGKINNNKSETVYQLRVFPVKNHVLQKIAIPEAVYLKKIPNNNIGIRIVDSFGDSLPLKKITTSPVLLEKKLAVNMYPLYESKYLLKRTNKIEFSYNNKNQLKTIEQGEVLKPRKKIIGYLIDLGNKKLGNNVDLLFNLTTAQQTSFLKMQIDKSNDLKRWRRITNREVLAQLVEEKKTVKHNRIILRNNYSRYVRIKLLDGHPPFLLTGVEKIIAHQKPGGIIGRTINTLHYNAQQKGFILNISPQLQYLEAVVNVNEKTPLLSGKIMSRSGLKDQWRFEKNFDVYHFNINNSKVLNNRIDLKGIHASQLKIIIDFPSARLQQLALTTSYMKNEVLFYASGNEPYYLQYGLGANKANNHHRTLSAISGVEPIPRRLASLGKGQLIRLEEKNSDSNINWSRILLWIILVSGVMAMALMAKSLLKKQKSG